MVKHLSIDREQNVSRVLALIKVETGYESNRFTATEPPVSLMGNKEVLTLRLASNLQDYMVKIDRPSFVIREIYEKLRAW